MRTIEQLGRFRRDFRRESKGQYQKVLTEEFVALVSRLACDEALPVRCRDHVMTGDWKDHRDCHIRPDLVLIYRKVDNVLQLVRLGSHAELGL